MVPCTNGEGARLRLQQLAKDGSFGGRLGTADSGTVEDLARLVLAGMRPVERYVRCTVLVPGGSVECGLERRRGEPLHWLRTELVRLVQDAAAEVLAGAALTTDTGGPLTDELERRFLAAWPERAWFVELWLEDEALTQVYSPWGMPKWIVV